jgi:hypothetical protein
MADASRPLPSTALTTLRRMLNSTDKNATTFGELRAALGAKLGVAVPRWWLKAALPEAANTPIDAPYTAARLAKDAHLVASMYEPRSSKRRRASLPIDSQSVPNDATTQPSARTCTPEVGSLLRHTLASFPSQHGATLSELCAALKPTLGRVDRAEMKLALRDCAEIKRTRRAGEGGVGVWCYMLRLRAPSTMAAAVVTNVT